MRIHPARLIAALLFISPAAFAQPPAQPLAQMPYAPSLDPASLDRSVDPCNNFYQYSCGGWMKNNPIPADQSSWDVYSKLANDNQQFLWGILQADATATARTPVQQKVGDYFAACMDTAAIDRRGLTPLAPDLAAIDQLHDRKSLIAALGTLHQHGSGTFFFNSGSAQDAGDSSQVIVDIGAGGLGLPDRDYYLKTDAKSIETRAKYLDYITRLLTLSGESATAAAADAATILRIETTLATASLTRVERRDPYKQYHKMTVAQLAAINPAISWPQYLTAQFAGVPNQPAIATLNVSQPAFQQAVNTVLTTDPLPALKAFLRFHLLAAAAPSVCRPLEAGKFEF